MKKSIKWLLAASIMGAFALAPAVFTAGSKEKASAVSTALDGKLIKIEDGSAVAASITGDPEYYVFYHSASW